MNLQQCHSETETNPLIALFRVVTHCVWGVRMMMTGGSERWGSGVGFGCWPAGSRWITGAQHDRPTQTESLLHTVHSLHAANITNALLSCSAYLCSCLFLNHFTDSTSVVESFSNQGSCFYQLLDVFQYHMYYGCYNLLLKRNIICDPITVRVHPGIKVEKKNPWEMRTAWWAGTHVRLAGWTQVQPVLSLLRCERPER